MCFDKKSRIIPKTTETAPIAKKYWISVCGVYKRTIWALTACPAASARNHILSICDLKAFGASLVVTDKPIGEISISPISHRNQEPTSHSGLTRPLVVPWIIPGNLIL